MSFDDLDAWLAWKASPWGRLRFALVGEVLARHLPAGSRVLDVGGGDGGDALPLQAAGHDVTVLDTSRPMLDLAAAAGLPVVEGSVDDLPSGYDALLCHFVLHYREDLPADVRRLVAAVQPGGLLSVAAPNPVGAVLRTLVREGPAPALEVLGAREVFTETFRSTVRWISVEEVVAAVEAAGCEVVGVFGGRTANDLLADDEAKQEPAYFADLLALELALHDREPYCRTGAFWQVLARVPGPTLEP